MIRAPGYGEVRERVRDFDHWETAMRGCLGSAWSKHSVVSSIKTLRFSLPRQHLVTSLSRPRRHTPPFCTRATLYFSVLLGIMVFVPMHGAQDVSQGEWTRWIKRFQFRPINSFLCIMCNSWCKCEKDKDHLNILLSYFSHVVHP